MEKRKSLIFLRNFFLWLSVLCLFILFILFLRFIKTGIEKKESVKPPVEVQHRVLFISSYDPLYFTYDSQIRGLEKALYPMGIEYDVAYMYSNGRGEAPTDMFYSFMKKRLANINRYEAILLGDDAALEFALEHQNELFPNLPMVFFGINNYSLAVEAAKNPLITGLYENDYLEETLNLAMALFPERKTLIGLHDQSVAGKIDIDTFCPFEDKYCSAFCKCSDFQELCRW